MSNPTASCSGDAMAPALGVVAPNQTILALYVSKPTLVAALYDPALARCRDLEVPNMAAGVQQLLLQPPPPVLLGAGAYRAV